MLAVERRSRMGGDLDRAHRLPARWIKGDDLISGAEPDMLTVVGHSSHLVDTRKGSVLTNDFG